MKKYKKYLSISLLLCFIFLSISCKKYVDIKRSSSQDLIETAEDCQLLLDNYANMNTEYPSDGTASSDDYFLTDAAYQIGTITTEDRAIYRWLSNSVRAKALPQWQAPYKTIYNANLVLETVEMLKDTPTQTLNALRGGALFFRAYSLWNIAQLYANPFKVETADQDLGIPLRLSSDINDKSSRGSVRQTYAQITKDLEEAATLLPELTPVPTRPSKSAAYSMLARVYLSMSNYDKALVNANLALQISNQLIDYNTLSVTSNTPFTRFNREVIFHSIMTRGATLVPGSSTNNVAKIDSTLLRSFNSNDLRSVIFFKSNTGANLGTYRFTGSYEPTTSSALFNGLAVDEVMLIQAECSARLGDVAAAMDILNRLLVTRWKTGTFIALKAESADDAINKILIERRKELVMRGQRWTDLRRINLDPKYAITLVRKIANDIYQLPPNDLRYTLLLPNDVIINAGLEQNPR